MEGRGSNTKQKTKGALRRAIETVPKIFVGAVTTINAISDAIILVSSPQPAATYATIVILIFSVGVVLAYGRQIDKSLQEQSRAFQNWKERRENQPVLSDSDAIHKLRTEVGNHILIREDPRFSTVVCPVLEIRLRQYEMVELVALCNGLPVHDRMSFEILRRKTIDGTDVYDPLGAAVARSCSKDSFIALVTDTNIPESEYWDGLVEMLRKGSDVEHNNIMLRVLVPPCVSDNDIETLRGLKKPLDRWRV